MVKYLMDAQRFYDMYKDLGERDNYYLKRFHKTMPIPVNIEYDQNDREHKKILSRTDLAVSSIFQDVDHKTSLLVTDEVTDPKYTIEKALMYLVSGNFVNI